VFDFANILLSGKCNARCPFCICKQIDADLNQANLDEYPLRNLDRFVARIKQEGIRQVVVTGTNTDPQLYRYEERLLDDLRKTLSREVQISLHTNGRMALRKMTVFNMYDRVAISLPSFNPQTYCRMMGVAGVPDLYEIMRRCNNLIKISCIITGDNLIEIGVFLEYCRELGVQRVVLRKLFGEKRSWQELLMPASSSAMNENVWMILDQIGDQDYRGNPLCELSGMQVTLWDFEQTQSTSLNLFSSGLISSDYLLARVKDSTAEIAENAEVY
jgi:molybdenum cofactor biosynthesis enzyme MoaA